MRCPYCGSPVDLRSADGIYYDNSRNTRLYVCRNYPQCDSYVRVHPGTDIPVGTMANRRLRALRAEAHRYYEVSSTTRQYLKVCFAMMRFVGF